MSVSGLFTDEPLFHPMLEWQLSGAVLNVGSDDVGQPELAVRLGPAAELLDGRVHGQMVRLE